MLVGDARGIRQRRNDDAGIADVVPRSVIGEQPRHSPTRKTLDTSHQAGHLGRVGLCSPEAGVIRLSSLGHVGIRQHDDAAVQDGGREVVDQYGSRPARLHAKAQGAGCSSAHPQSFESGATRRMARKKENGEAGRGTWEGLSLKSPVPRPASLVPLSFNPSTLSANTFTVPSSLANLPLTSTKGSPRTAAR